MEFQLFGPVELRTAAGPVDLGTPREHHVLAAEAGRLVPVSTLIEPVWGPDAPPGARATLRVYLAHIRKVLDKANSDSDRPAALVRRPGGYLLDIDADQVDLHRFRRLVGQARDSGHTDDQRAALLRQALDLPAGEPLADLSGGWAERARVAWTREYLDAVLAWAGAALAAGDGGSASGLLAELADQHTLNESLAAALMRALHAAGRGSEALKRSADMRARLEHELGTGPGAELQAVHQQILRGEPVTGRSPARRPPRPGAGVVPAQLPADLVSFAGRIPYLDQLDTLLATRATTVVVTAIDGTAGVGKPNLELWHTNSDPLKRRVHRRVPAIPSRKPYHVRNPSTVALIVGRVRVRFCGTQGCPLWTNGRVNGGTGSGLVAVGGDRGHLHQPRSRGDRGWCPGGADKGECCVVSRPGRPVTFRCRGGVSRVTCAVSGSGVGSSRGYSRLERSRGVPG